MFTDVVGSTALRDGLVVSEGEIEGDRYYREQILDPHNSAIRALLARFAGYEVKTNGDSFMASFATPTDAVRCAVEIQRAFRDHPIRTESGSLAVRIGVHTGQATLYKGKAGWDYDGHTVNIAARIEALLKGGEQILCSRATRTVAGNLPGVAYDYCGAYTLKGVGEPVEVFEILWYEGQGPKSPEPPTIEGSTSGLSAVANGAVQVLVAHGFSDVFVEPESDLEWVRGHRNGRLLTVLVLAKHPLTATRQGFARLSADVVIGTSDLRFFDDESDSERLDREGDRFVRCVCTRDIAEFDAYLSLLSVGHLQSGSLFTDLYPQSQFEEPAIGKDLEQKDGSPALVELFTWLSESASSFCVVLGDYGSGKSFLAREFTRRVTQSRAQGADLPMALYVDLATALAPGELPTAENILASRLGQLGLDSGGVGVLIRLVRAGLIMPVLDGFDERAIRLKSYDDQLRLLADLRALATPQAKVLLTSRTQLFTSVKELQSNSKTGTIVHLLPFDRPRIEGALRRMLGAQSDEALNLIDNIYNLSELASRPVLLTMIAGILGRLRKLQSEGRTVGASDVYEQFAEAWLDRDRSKHTLTPDEKLRGMAAVARELWERGALGNQAPGIGWQELPSWLQQQLGLAQTLADREVVDRDIRTAAFLSRDSEGSYRFAHRSFLEFFLARGIAEALGTGDTMALDLAPLSREAIAFAVDVMRLAGRGVAAIESVLQNRYRCRISENAARIMVAWSRSDSVSAPQPEMVRLEGASLAAEDLRGVQWPSAQLARADLFDANLTDANLAGADLSDADLRNVRARRARLAGAMLVRARLARADLESADLRGVNATEADAAGSRFIKADLSNAQFDFAHLISASLVGARRGGLSVHGANLSCVAGIEEVSSISRVAGPKWGGHTRGVLSIAYARDGKTLASGSDDKTVRLWDAATGRPIATLKGNESIESVAYAPDGKTLASGSWAGTVLWDAATGKLIATLEGQTRVRAIAYSPDGKTLASGAEDHTVLIWDTGTGTPIITLTGHSGSVMSVAYAPDGKTLASGSVDQTVRLWDPATGMLIATLEGHVGAAWSLAFSLDSKTLVSGSPDRTVRLWDVASGRSLATLKGHSKSVLAVAFAPDGKTLASGSMDHTVRLWHTTTGQALATLKGHTDIVESVAFAPDGRTVASGAADKTVRLWDGATGKPIVILNEGYANPVASVAFAPPGTTLALGCDDHTVRLCEAATGKPVATLKGHSSSVESVAYALDGKTIASGSSDKTVRLWDAVTGEPITTLEGHYGSVESVAYAPDGKTLASGSDDRTVRLWETGTWKLIATMYGHTQAVEAVAYAPDGKTLASGSKDGTVRLWDIATGKLITILEGHSGSVMSVAYSPDGKALASGSEDHSVRLWDAATGKLIATMDGHTKAVESVAYAPDGKTLASGSNDQTVRLWDAAAGKPIAVLRGHSGRVRSVSYAPDGKTLASGSDDDTVRLWDAVIGQARSQFASVGDGWFCAVHGGLPEGNEIGLRAITYVSRDLRIWSGYELCLAAEEGQQFQMQD